MSDFSFLLPVDLSQGADGNSWEKLSRIGKRDSAGELGVGGSEAGIVLGSEG